MHSGWKCKSLVALMRKELVNSSTVLTPHTAVIYATQNGGCTTESLVRFFHMMHAAAYLPKC